MLFEIIMIVLNFFYNACMLIAVGISIVLGFYYVTCLVVHLKNKVGKHGRENVGS